MASISKDPGGKRRILFVAPDGRRRAIRLGKTSQRNAEHVKIRVERLLETVLTGNAMDTATAQWVDDLNETMAAKLERAGLLPNRKQSVSVKLGPVLREYIESRVDLKPATKIVKGQVIRDLTQFFDDHARACRRFQTVVNQTKTGPDHDPQADTKRPFLLPRNAAAKTDRRKSIRGRESRCDWN